MLAEDIAWAVDGISFRETYPDGWIPVNYLVETLSRYFDGIDRPGGGLHRLRLRLCQ